MTFRPTKQTKLRFDLWCGNDYDDVLVGDCHQTNVVFGCLSQSFGSTPSPPLPGIF